jgi:hypothetical protein
MWHSGNFTSPVVSTELVRLLGRKDSYQLKRASSSMVLTPGGGLRITMYLLYADEEGACWCRSSLRKCLEGRREERRMMAEHSNTAATSK